jgi:hypothetical protein
VAEENITNGIKAVEKEKELAKRGLLLGTFIERVKHERKTFFERLIPGQTVCKDSEGEFTWKPEHPLTVIRTYAEQVANGSIVAGELTRRACARFLGDLASGADRELFIDPVAVENISTCPLHQTPSLGAGRISVAWNSIHQLPGEYRHQQRVGAGALHNRVGGCTA